MPASIFSWLYDWGHLVEEPTPGHTRYCGDIFGVQPVISGTLQLIQISAKPLIFAIRSKYQTPAFLT